MDNVSEVRINNLKNVDVIPESEMNITQNKSEDEIKKKEIVGCQKFKEELYK